MLFVHCCEGEQKEEQKDTHACSFLHFWEFNQLHHGYQVLVWNFGSKTFFGRPDDADQLSEIGYNISSN